MNAFQPSLALLGSLGGPEIALIVFLVVLLFGAKKLPELARSTGKAMREFKKATSEAEETFKSAIHEEDIKEQQKKSASESTNHQSVKSTD